MTEKRPKKLTRAQREVLSRWFWGRPGGLLVIRREFWRSADVLERRGYLVREWGDDRHRLYRITDAGHAMRVTP